MFSNKFNIGVLKHPGYNVGGGIGEAALIGAAFSGGKALVTGEDPLQAALLGGITGGAMSGVTSALLPGAATAGTEVGKTAVGQVANSVDDLAMASTQGTIQNGVIQGANTGLNVANTVNPALTSTPGLTAYTGQVTPNFAAVPNVASVNTGIAGVPGSMTPFQTAPVGMGQGASAGIAEAAPIANVNKELVNTVTAQPYTASQPVAAAADKPFEPLKRMLNPTPGGTLEKGLDFAIENPYMTAGIGGAAYGALTAKPPEMPNDKEEKSPLAGYDRESFTAYDAPRPDPYPQPQYTDYYKYGKEGGVMQSYAQGGIASLAQGGMGGNMGYPQGRLDTTQYATPSQMPTSAQVVNADYEVPTDPYMGSPLKMAEGGVTGYALGGVPNSGSQVYYDNQTGQYYTQSGTPMMNMMSNVMGGNGGRNYIGGSGGRGGMGSFGSKMGQMDVDPSVGEYKVEPVKDHYQARYEQQAPTLEYSGPQGGMAPTYSLADSVPLLAATNPGIAQSVASATGMAGGGIAGYSLGGYAAGGNPRLLKGPGDGMSDNIPATIGDRQPARLADGEFVVPADVVSHLGNGSTDAGAKHLYTMMDKVRKARTGNKKQGKQINPTKFMPT